MTIKNRPSKEELIQKYKELGSARKLGDYYGVSHITALAWMKSPKDGKMTKKSDGLFSNATKEQWLALKEDIGNKLQKRSEGICNEEDKKYIEDYLKKGIKEKWIDLAELIRRKRHFCEMNKYDWIAYGRLKEYNKLSRNELREQNNNYYRRGLKKGWLDELIPKKSGPLESAIQDYIGK
jgi:hypothetical protein